MARTPENEDVVEKCNDYSMEYSKLNYQLLDACKSQDFESVKYLLSIGANAAYEKITGQQHSSTSPIIAPRRGAMVRQVVRAGFVDCNGDNIELVTETQRTCVLPFPRSPCDAKCTHVSPLHEVLMRAPEDINLVLVETLLKAGAHVNAICKTDTWRACNNAATAFQMALTAIVQADNLQLLDLFLLHGADPNAALRSHCVALRSMVRSLCAPLHLAVEGLRLQCVERLLDAGAEVDAVRVTKKRNFRRIVEQDSEETALHIACRALARFETSGSTLSNSDSDSNLEESGSGFDASGTARGDAVTALAIIKLLLVKGANVNAVCRYLSSDTAVPVCETALHIAVKAKLANLTWQLVSAGADRDQLCQEGCEPCLSSCSSCSSSSIIPDNITITIESTNEDVTNTTNNHNTIVLQTAWELLLEGDEATRQALMHVWTPATHHLHDPRVRQSIVTLLLVARRLLWPFPELVLRLICSFVAS